MCELVDRVENLIGDFELVGLRHVTLTFGGNDCDLVGAALEADSRPASRDERRINASPFLRWRCVGRSVADARRLPVLRLLG